MAPLTTIVPGVLPGSKGPLKYEAVDIQNAVQLWDDVPIVVYHPTHLGMHVSAQHEGVLAKSGIGFLRNSKFADKLQHEGWFDIENTKRVDVRVYDSLIANKPMELSTGLFTDNVDGFARNHRPDHLAVLPDQVGACSIKDGCGVLVNKGVWTRLREFVVNALGGGNHGIAKLSAHAEELAAIAEAEGTPEAYKAAAQAYADCAEESAKPTATGGKADYTASGAFKVKSASLSKLAANCGGPGGTPGPCKEAQDASRAANGATSRADKMSAAAKSTLEHKDSANAHYDAANSHKMAAAHHEPGAEQDKHVAIAKEHMARGDSHYRQSKGLSANEGTTMTKAEKVAHLTANCECWKGEEKVLNEMKEPQIDALYAANAAQPAALKKAAEDKKNKAGADEEDDDEDDSELEVNFLAKPREERFTPEELETWDVATGIARNEKKKLVEKLVANVKDATRKTELTAKFEKMRIPELQDFVSLLPPAKAPSPSYVGNAGAGDVARPAIDASQDLLDLPVTNWGTAK